MQYVEREKLEQASGHVKLVGGGNKQYHCRHEAMQMSSM